MSPGIPAILVPVELMPFAGSAMELALAPACRSTLVIRTAAAARNVFRTTTAIARVPASTTSARIHVPVPVASMPSAGS